MSTSYKKVGWLAESVSQHGEKEVLDELAKEGLQVFYKKWTFTLFSIGFDIIQSSSYMILQIVVNHFSDLKNGGSELFCNRKLVHGENVGHWNLQFQHAGSKGSGA
jgi:hypothetical protein